MRFLTSAALVFFIHIVFGQANTWTTRQDFAGGQRYLATSFAIGSKVYLGTGLTPSQDVLGDFWQYDIASNTWAPKNNFEGAARLGAVGFSINGKGYVALGGNLLGSMFNDIWEYNPVTDDWTKKKDFPGNGRAGSFVFVVNNKAYIGSGGGASADFNDLWEYDPSSDQWTQKLSMPSSTRTYASAFAIGTKGYVGMGVDTNDDPINDFWEYNTVNDQWTRKADFPISEAGQISFATSTRGYVGGGSGVSMYSYYPSENKWVQQADIPASTYIANGTCSFANGKAYVGAGFTLPMGTDFYEYTPGSEQTITFNALAAKTFGDASFGLTATSSSALAVSYSSSNTSVATISGSTVTIVGSGTTTITASQAGNGTFDVAIPIQQVLTVNKANQTITFNTLGAKNVNDVPFTLTATTTSGLTISYTSSNTNVATVSGNTVTIVGSGTTTITANQAGNGNYNAATSVGRDLVVNKVSQSITFGPLPSKNAGDGPFGLTGSASSGLPVSYTSSNTDVATVSGSTVTIVGGGTTTITASQAGNATYAAAASIGQPLNVAKGSQSWVGALPTTGGYGNKITLSLHLSSGLQYSLTSSNTSIATVAIEASNWVVTPVGIGTTTLTASHAGNASFDAAPTLTADLVISKGTQTIAFDNIPTKKWGVDFQFAVFPEASSGLPVSLETNASYEIQIYGNNIIVFNAFNGTITAKQPGNDLYLPATPVTKSIVVQRGDIPITMEPIPEKAIGDPAFTPVTVPLAGYVWSSSNPAVATISNSQVLPVGKGTTTITASLVLNSDNNASSASQQLVVKDAHQITFALPNNEVTVGDPPFEVSATASSGLPVTFTSDNTSIATVSGTTVTIVAPGDVTITASAGNANYKTTGSSQRLHVKNVSQTPREQGQLWGLQSFGGVNKAGAIFTTNSDGSGFAIVKEFKANLDYGSRPASSVILASSGKMYGFTQEGGANGAGVFFEYDPATGTTTKKYDFLQYEYANSTWITSPNGKIYGIKSNATTDFVSGPVVFEFDLATGSFSKVGNLHGLINQGTDVVMSANGKVYVSGSGINLTSRVFYEFNLSTGSVVKKAEFLTDYAYGSTGMVELPNGKFMGTTTTGGSLGEGFIFEFDPVAGTATPKLEFQKSGFNTTTAQGLMRASNGKLYGNVSYGGPDQVGFIYEYDPAANTLTKLAFFPKYGGVPTGKLVEGANGRLYGTGNSGGAGGQLFEFNPITNELRTMFLFTDATGKSVRANLAVSGNKVLGFANDGGAKNGGTLFEFDYTTRVINKLFDFGGVSGGYIPMGGLTPASNGKLYGVTQRGGANDDGTVFEYDPMTNEITTKFEFNNKVTGRRPEAKLTLGFNGKFYGATYDGGPFNSGTLFEFDPSSGTLRIIANLWYGGPGDRARGQVAVAPSGLIYSTAIYSGANNYGTLIELDPATKDPKKIFDFSQSTGTYPANGVMIASNGKLYGTTNGGGANNFGVLFEYDIKNKSFAVKHDFDNASGARPYGNLTELNGKLYGTTQTGGAGSTGVIFEYNIQTGGYAKKYDITIGAGTGGQLLLAANGKMYGNTTTGGRIAGGVGFEYDPATSAVKQLYELPPSTYVVDVNMTMTQTVKSFYQDQSITIDPIAAKTVGGPAFTPTATASSGLTLVFSPGNNKITVTNNVVSMVAAGKATIKANQAGNASYNAAPEAQAIFCINPAKPAISATGANSGIMTLSSSNGTGNQWYKDDAAIAGATGNTLQITQPGIYTVQTTVEECMGELSSPYPVIITGDVDANSETIAVYPNPVQERLYITLPGGNQKRVTLVQMDGRIAEEHHTSTALLEVDVRNYSQGLYLVRIADENGERPAIKFIKK